MKIIHNKFLPFGRFNYLTVLAWLFVKIPAKLSARVYNHEKIHMRQQLEIVVACLAINAGLIGWTDSSWWWLLMSIPAPFLVYGLSVGIELLLPPYDRAYGNSCFETEAIYNEHSLSYTRQWWRHFFAWVGYVSNRKFPYIAPRLRPPMEAK